jgi:hypothetical protein
MARSASHPSRTRESGVESLDKAPTRVTLQHELGGSQEGKGLRTETSGMTGEYWEQKSNVFFDVQERGSEKLLDLAGCLTSNKIKGLPMR